MLKQGGSNLCSVPMCTEHKSKVNLVRLGVYITCFFLFFGLICGLFYVNIQLVQEETPKSLKEIFLSFFKDYGDVDNPYDVAFEPLKRIIWINFAGMISGVALTISSAIAQAITQNPLSDATTLGMVDASIFGIILMKTFFAEDLIGDRYHLFYFLFSFFGSALILLFLMCFLKKRHTKDLMLKITLFGLILNLFFRALVHLLKAYSINAVNTIYALSLGGPENVYQLYPSQYQVLLISLGILFLVFIGALLLARQLNLIELGIEQATSLGVNYKFVKFAGFLIVLFSSSLAITLAGNIAFIGLLTTHIVRNLFRTRKYEIILVFASGLSMIFFMLSILWNIYFPQIPTSIFILFFGSITLLYLSQKR